MFIGVVSRYCPGLFPERPGADAESLTIIGAQVWVFNTVYCELGTPLPPTCGDIH